MADNIDFLYMKWYSKYNFMGRKLGKRDTRISHELHISIDPSAPHAKRVAMTKSDDCLVKI